ncbi:putative ion transporter superfamily protein YfcC [Scopulibacillus darangshiensis]|uniref:Putative ion transporter superfamily protein YfcC n=1 Tax=Scopulibacillus darangshiensis TaxID=442528 RepID=A0A4R2P463_9BACL|nr:YfcC family protein [Scopulibacillus darangshiensis]TCP29427.1 putative ion transporter superfamily protein YfcC [Scopulibacillus darangshiensis]
MKAETEKPVQRKKLKIGMPDAYVILFIILLLAVASTYLFQAGEFDRKTEDGVTTVVPDSYHTVASRPADFMDLFLSIQGGLVETAQLIFLVLIVGGAFAVVESTGAVDAGIMKAINKTKNKQYVLIIAIAVLFSIGGLLGIIVNAVIAFVPIGIILAKAMKADAIAGIAMIKLGAYVGFNTSFLDPATTGYAQKIAELPLYSGAIFRAITYVIILGVTIAYICLYIRRVKKDPARSIMGDERFAKSDIEVPDQDVPFTTQHKIVLTFFGLTVLFYVFGVFKFDWSLNHMTALFLFIAIGTGILAKMTPNKVVSVFMGGAQKLIYGALVIGFARAIVIILENGKILDTVVHGLAVALEPFSSVTGAIGMFFANSIFALIVSSGSGMAAVLMPILTPLADIMDIPRQVAVQTYKLADGFMNAVTPTSGVLMACLAIGGVSWTKWIKFMFPLVIIWYVISCVTLAIGVWIGWGPN